MKTTIFTGCAIMGFIGLCMAFAFYRPPQRWVVAQMNGMHGDSLSDATLLDSVEHATFLYFWKGAEPRSGMAPERIHMDGVYPQHDRDVIAVGGSGFGIMAILAGMHRGYITRRQGFERINRIVDFLARADRFHGAWPHWLYPDGKVKPFSPKDDGGDIVETAYLVQGLLCARQYFLQGNAMEQQLAQRIDRLWKTVEWNWYQHGQQVLYWHWSPDYGWAMNFPIHGYNECLIAYVLAASSPTHAIPASAYHQGWAEDGKIVAPSWHYGYELQLHHQGDAALGGPLFWAHYSYLGLDPHELKDRYADYWKENVDQTMINYLWCVHNPLHYRGYGPHNWGLTASYSPNGYAAHAPGAQTDLGVISPTAAVSSIVYTPHQSMQAIRYWFTTPQLKDKIWGPYGFYDAFSETANWFPPRYLAIDQGPQVVMIENYRSGLLWRLFMSCEEVQQGLKKLGFHFAKPE